MAWSISHDESPLLGCEVAVSHVDRDALLALGKEAIDKQRKIRPSKPRSFEDFSIDSSWSASTDFVSCNNRPTKVDLPSSTLPAVHRRRVSRVFSVATELIRNSLPSCGLPWQIQTICHRRGLHRAPTGWR